MPQEVIPFPDADCPAVREALNQVSAALERFGAALKAKKVKKTRKTKAATGKKR
jgi:hypothetical protein